MIKYLQSTAAYGLIAVPLREMVSVGVSVAKDKSKRMRIVSLLLGLQIQSWFHLDSLENLGLLNRTAYISNHCLLISLVDTGGRLNLFNQGYSVPPETYSAIKAPKGEVAVYLVSYRRFNAP
ncbi:uncharacterized protein EDB91DRAFT_1086454 [Suillus paluster]|uniref:uncharacterized protein n=1 Tax=Suillus paluster TaxID=48578 RepID=UPI001B865261|nr:uncharacterized protein EDB91DRAFT_1086454 [Suillus paluster]KAG1727383.1 hypothetical protein EDB91DRAFT_1086454 [Suillus paluster]